MVSLFSYILAQSENDGDRLRFPAVNFHFKITIFSLTTNPFIQLCGLEKDIVDNIKIGFWQNIFRKIQPVVSHIRTFVFLSSISFVTEWCISFIQKDTIYGIYDWILCSFH